MLKKIVTVIVILSMSNFAEASKKPEGEKPLCEEREAKKIKIVSEKQEKSESTAVSQIATSAVDQSGQNKASLLNVVIPVKELQKIILGYLTWEGDCEVIIEKEPQQDTSFQIIEDTDFKFLWDGRIELSDRYLLPPRIKTFTGHRDQVYAVAVSDNNACRIRITNSDEPNLPATRLFLISASYDKTIKIWDMRSCACINTFKQHKNSAKLALSADSDSVIIPDALIIRDELLRERIKKWDRSKNRPEEIFLDYKIGPIYAVAFLNDQDIILGDWFGNVRVFNCVTGKFTGRAIKNESRVRSLAVIRDSRSVILGLDDATVKIWDLVSRKIFTLRNGHRGSVNSVTSNSKFIVSGSDDMTIKIWNAVSGAYIKTLEGHGGAVNFVAISADSKFIISGSEDKTIKIWDIDSQTCIKTLEGHRGAVNSVAISKDSSYIVSGSTDTTVKIWDFSSGNCIQTLCGHTDSINSVMLLSDNEIVSRSDDNMLKIWPTQAKQIEQAKEIKVTPPAGPMPQDKSAISLPTPMHPASSSGTQLYFPVDHRDYIKTFVLLVGLYWYFFR